MSNINIPDQLRKQLFIKTYNKIPIENNWSLDPSLYVFNKSKSQWINILTDKSYMQSNNEGAYTSPNRNNYYINELNLKYKNYGVLCGYNGLIVVDVDIPELDEFLHTIPEFQETFAVRTANSQLTHFYFYCENNKHPPIVRVNYNNDTKKRICDIQGVGTQVIGPGSKVKCSDGNIREYKVISNNQINSITYEQINDIIEEFSKKYKIPIKWLSSDNARKKETVTNTNEYIEKDPICKSIKEHIKIQDLLKIWGIDTSKNPCESPFTQDSKNRASFSYTDHIFNDFHTNQTGTIFHLFMQYNKVDFATAKYQLGLIAGIETDDYEFISDNYRFFYFTDNSLQKFGLINLKNNEIIQMRKNEIIDYIVYTNPNVYESLGINTKNITKKRNQLSEKIFSYLELPNNIEVLAGFGYRPVNDKVFEFNGKKFINQYIVPKLHTKDIVENTTSKDFPNINRLIQHLCKNNQEIYDYFMDWISFQLKNPLLKLPTSFIFMGAHGTGKGVLKKLVLDYIFGEDNVTEVTQPTIIKGWGDYIRNARIIFADEINLHSKQYEDVCDRLKNNTADPKITVDIKRKDSQKIQNFTHWIFTSNKDLPFQIEKGDRRYIVVEQLKKIDIDIVEAIDITYNKAQHNKEIYMLYSHLMRRNPEFKTLSSPLHTEEKQDLIEATMNNTIKFIKDLRSYDNFQDFMGEISHKIPVIDGCISVMDFYKLFNKWCNLNGVLCPNKNNFSKEIKNEFDVESKHKRMLDNVKRAYDLNEILGREPTLKDIPAGSNDSTDELNKDMQEFEI